jgi:hypothetical protein
MGQILPVHDPDTSLGAIQHESDAAITPSHVPDSGDIGGVDR